MLTGTIICLAALPGAAAQQTARLRLAWGGGASDPTRWSGEISVEGGVLTDLQPLGIEADGPVALRIDGNRVIVAPREVRGFDGCDLTVRADEKALVSILLQADQSPQPTRIEVPFAQLATGEFRQALKEPGSNFLAHRAPGDKLRVLSSRAHYVFDPDEVWTLSLQADFSSELSAGPVDIDMELWEAGSEEALWRTSQQLAADATKGTRVDFEIACPAAEGAYTLTIVARRPDGIATRFVPGRWAKALDKRDVEFVVIDPAARLPDPDDRWSPVLTIDPANPKWWQRLPAWTRVPGLPERMPGAIGNVRPAVRPGLQGDFVELPGIAKEKEPWWQSYTLPIREPGRLHMVEVAYPRALAQHLSISIVELDAAGRVQGVQQDVGFYASGESSGQEDRPCVHRFVFWPRTRAPQLLLVNRQPHLPAQYGQIKLYQHAGEAESGEAQLTGLESVSEEPARMVAGYISQPVFAANFGASEKLDAGSGLSVHSWSTFLDAAHRLVQYLRLNGQNAVFLTVAADGSALYPSRRLNPSPRYDTGLQASSGQDPRRKDVLEMLLRILDREGVRLISTFQLATPLPLLEHEKRAADATEAGIGLIGREGREWVEQNGTDHGLAPHYNPLNLRVQAEVDAILGEFAERYAAHRSLVGIGVQVAGSGYGVLPGLAWGLDDTTVARFESDTGIHVSATGPQKFRQRAGALLGEYRGEWTRWRTQELTAMYAGLAQSLTAKREDLQLYLATESLFSGPALSQRLRQSISNPVNLQQVLLEHGVDLAGLNAIPGVTALSTLRQNASGRLQRRALDLRINSASARGELMTSGHDGAQLLYQAASGFRLPSFDERSPFGAAQTHLVVGSQALPAGDAQRRQLIASMARQDAAAIVLGGQNMSLATHSELRQVLRTLQQLPPPDTAERTLNKQPLVARIYRSKSATTIALVNESPWRVQVQLPLEASVESRWQQLGGGRKLSNLAAGQQQGVMAVGSHQWQLELKPFDLQAWRFDTSSLLVGEPRTAQDHRVRYDLEQRIQQVESRMGNLDIERPYHQLQNPGFELGDGGPPILGWQSRQGDAGSVQLDNAQAHQGDRALRLTSKDALGVAVQSHLFSMPETGQLVVSAFLRRADWGPDARLHIVVEDGSDGRAYRQFAVLGEDEPMSDQWAQYNFLWDDLPLDTAGQMHIQFHLTGRAEVMIDDVELYDLRFSEDRRRTFLKDVYAAQDALQRGHVVDCLRRVDEYWSQYLVEFVPPLEKEPASLATQPQDTAEVEPQPESKGIRERIKGWSPKIWR
ncbi:MAG: family 10 glycosylhydrolase [Pirellulales bacterium]|nr:family 10 glycosylhydrolase [Pirellulales bacterium]